MFDMALLLSRRRGGVAGQQSSGAQGWLRGRRLDWRRQVVGRRTDSRWSVAGMPGGARYRMGFVAVFAPSGVVRVLGFAGDLPLQSPGREVLRIDGQVAVVFRVEDALDGLTDSAVECRVTVPGVDDAYDDAHVRIKPAAGRL